MGIKNKTMTPTLKGRWQTRILLLVTIGTLVTYCTIYLLQIDTQVPWSILGYVLLFGCIWDVFYNYLQTFRWDRDWPPAFQLAAGFIEAIVLWLVLNQLILPGIPQTPSITIFTIHYSVVWLSTFIASQGPIRIIFPRWRYHGGKWYEID